VNGFIEIYVDGWKRYRWQFTLKDYETFPFEQQVDLRKADLDTIIGHLKEHVVSNFDPSRIETFIVYESKLNSDAIGEIPESEANEIYNGSLQGNERPGNGEGAAGGRCERVNILP
jgi:hypothetical protein